MEGFQGNMNFNSGGGAVRQNTHQLLDREVGSDLQGDFDPMELLKSPLFRGQSEESVLSLGQVNTGSGNNFAQVSPFNGVGAQQLGALNGVSPTSAQYNAQGRAPDMENTGQNFSPQTQFEMGNNFAMQQNSNTSQFQAAGNNDKIIQDNIQNIEKQIQEIQANLQMNNIQGGNMQVNQVQPDMLHVNQMQAGGLQVNQMQTGNMQANQIQVNQMQTGNVQNSQVDSLNVLNGSMSTLNVEGSNNTSIGSLSASYSNGLTANFNGSFQDGTFQDGAVQDGSLNAGGPTVAQLSASLKHKNKSQLSPGDRNGPMMSPGGQDQGQLNEAMEKLCESMRRSAMSRNLVKQLSGRSLTRQGSSRSLSRQNSGMLLRKQNSLKNLSVDGDGTFSASNTPIRTVPIRRLSDAKHRLARAAPVGRGVFRNSSQGAAGGDGNTRSAPRTFLQLDDNSLGAF